MEELRDARLLWIQSNQTVLVRCQDYKQLELTLNFKVDDNDIIHSYGRMRYANILEITKAPIILSKVHRLSLLIVLHSHVKVLHRGMKQTFNE